jgi:hypothetical protein
MAAHFRGTVQGNRSEVSRLGSKDSGLLVTANGWDFGVDVSFRFCEETGKDTVRIDLTGGSNGCRTHRILGIFTVDDLNKPIKEINP